MPAGHFWTPEQDAQLRQHWDAGHSTAEIGRRMGVTKNSIIGRAHRLLLPPRAAICNSALAPVSDRQRDIIRNLWRAEPITAICRLTGLDNRRVKKLAVEMDLPEKSRGVVFRPAARSPELPRERRARAAFPSPARPGDPRPAVASGLIGVSSQPNSPGAASNPRPVFLAGKCQFPLWSNRERPTHAYCEAPTVARRNGCASPFCATHYAVAYEPPRPKPERKAA
jgi:hypothetical protein